MDFTSFNQNNDTFTGNLNRSELPNLPPGSYTFVYNQQSHEFEFKKFNMNYDKIIDLPSPEYDHVMTRINTFLSADTKQAFEDYGFLYKWNCMLWGTYGTGKTILVNRVAEKIVKKGGVVLFNPDPRLITAAFKILEDIQPDRTTMVIFEEFDSLLRIKDLEAALLSLLDGEIQKNNVVYMATTNHFENIPARLKRPGRFATILEVKFPSSEARKAYLQGILKPRDLHEVPEWVRATAGLSIDELKETVQSVKCYRNTLQESVERILAVRNIVRKGEQASAEGRPMHTEEVLDKCEESLEKSSR